MNKLFIVTLLLAMPAVAEENWFLAQEDGTCQESKGSFSWLTPETMARDYSCLVEPEINSLVSVYCEEGPLKGKSYAFTKDSSACKLFAAMLQSKAL